MDKQEKIKAIQNRDNKYDGKFFCGVKTTKIVCFPSCPSRTPLEKNIELFDTLEEAIQNGYRPCKRCNPDIKTKNFKENK